MASSLPASNNRKMFLTTAAVLAVGLGAYGLGRVYPPLGPSEGTVGPAERYVNSQVGEGDVTLGDTSVPQLMQSDAFEALSNRSRPIPSLSQASPNPRSSSPRTPARRTA